MPFDSDFMNYVGFQLYGGGTDPAYDSFRGQSDPFADELDAELFSPVDGYTARIIIHYHTRFGDALYIRGDSYPLSWYSGSRCEYHDENTWVYELMTTFDYHTNVN